MSKESNELIREVTNSLRNDKVKEFYQKNSKAILIGLSLVILVVLVIVGQNIYQNSKNKKYSANIQSAITSQQVGNVEESQEDLEKTFYDKSSPEKLRVIAGFRLAAVYLKKADEDSFKKVIPIYEEISSCKQCTTFSKDLAGMLWVKFSITTDKETSYEELINKINQFQIASKTFRYEIAIDKAFYELEQNHLDKSLEIFKSVSESLEAKEDAKNTAKEGIRIVEQRIANQG
ncbi:MAG: hypothetical protein ISQ34_02120 [Rickettsiales bacterium]|nr:hypothetical protein [Rickettsiales bacterium]